MTKKERQEQIRCRVITVIIGIMDIVIPVWMIWDAFELWTLF